jgi:hypothetical protein
MKLYHGTSILRWNRIQLTGFIEPPSLGDDHVSFTTDKAVASYFAHLAWLTPDEDEKGMVVLSTTTSMLESKGVFVKPFSSEVWGPGECDWEKEMACTKPVSKEILRVESIFGPISRGPNKTRSEDYT